MEELPSFTAGYAYSLVSNTFVQKADSNLGTKHLMTLGTSHVATSLRKHGSGLADALVNAVTQLLTRQMALLSQARLLRFKPTTDMLSIPAQGFLAPFEKTVRVKNY